MRVLMLTWEYPPRSVGGVGRPRRRARHAMAAAGHDVALLTLAHPGVAGGHADQRGARAAGPHRPAVAARRRPRRPGRVGEPPPRAAVDAARAVAARHHPRPRLAGRLGRRHARRAVRRPARRHVPRHRAAATTAGASRLASRARSTPSSRGSPTGPTRCSPTPRFMVREIVGGFELPAGAHPPHPQRHRPDVVVDGRGARHPRAARVHVGPGAVREGLPGARPGDAPAARRGCPASAASSPAAAATSRSCSRRSISRASATSSSCPASCPTTSSATPSTGAGCVVIPSLYEPFGIVALEALAGGAPLVVARTGGLAELVDGTGAGLLFEPGNAAELAACIELVLERRGPRRRDAQARRRAARRPLLVAGHRRGHGERLRRPPVGALSRAGSPSRPAGVPERAAAGPLPSRPCAPSDASR